MSILLEFVQSLKYLAKPKDERSKNRLYVFAICLAVSLSIWLMIKMSKEYNTDVEFPIEYTNFPQDQTITNIKDSTISLKLESKGFNLFSDLYIKKKKPFRVNLRSSRIHSNRYTLGNYVITSTLLPQIRMQFEDAENIIGISPDTLFFHIENISSKIVPIEFDINISTKKQFDIYGDIRKSIDSVIVYGPPSIIDTVNSIKTAKLSLNQIDKSVKNKLALLKPKGLNIDYSVDSVELDIQVEEFTEGVIIIPFNYVADREIRFFPNEVSVRYLVALKDFQNIKAEMFEAQVIFNPNRQRTQKVQLSKFPAYIKINRIEPETVEYIILR